MRNNKGFTLLEILLVIGIIATLAVVVIVALDPAGRFEDAQNSRRLSDIQNILSAVQQYVVDNKGDMPSGLNTTEKQIGTSGESCSISTGPCSVETGECLDLTSDLSRYLKDIPYDPENGITDRTHYSISIDSNNIVTVRACDSTDQSIWTVSR